MRTFETLTELEEWFNRNLRLVDLNTSLTLWEQRYQEDIVKFIYACNYEQLFSTTL